MREHRETLLQLPYSRRSLSYLLHEDKLRACGLLGEDQSTSDWSNKKYDRWELVPLPTDDLPPRRDARPPPPVRHRSRKSGNEANDEASSSGSDEQGEMDSDLDNILESGRAKRSKRPRGSRKSDRPAKSKRTIQMRVGDTGGIFEYLQSMQLEDPAFVSAMQADEDDMITNIFWADGRMMTDYFYFGDVLFFDTTYKKNKECRLFAMFLGVNHHKQTIIFGTALLYDETAETFAWLFDTFAKTMSGKKPKTILTDQDAAMEKALESQWPETTHRLCIWHIYQNAPKNLSGVFQNFREFTKDFSSCIYDYDEKDVFIEAWNSMLEKYDLRDNKWLKKMFNLKEKWALVYGRETFCADMTTTQRSESMNNVIKNYVSYKHEIPRFFQHFQRLVEDRRYDEFKADFKSTQTSLSLSLPIEILKHTSIVYTPAVFRMFEKEFCKAYDCAMNIKSENGTVSEYTLTPHGKVYEHIVTYDSSNDTVTCGCKKFDFAGILCAHILKLAKKAAEDEKAYKIVVSAFSKIFIDLDANDRAQGKEISTSTTRHNDIENKNNNGISDQIKGFKTKRKAHGGSRRIKGALERAKNKKKMVKEDSPSQQDFHEQKANDQINNGSGIPFLSSNYFQENMSSSFSKYSFLASERSIYIVTSIPPYTHNYDGYEDLNENTSMTVLLQQAISTPNTFQRFIGNYFQKSPQ
ncbi:protein FAR1-RELATED SEQUENCE 9-like [Humulus lupulus]|uniref:protein FAR1-RELATED SEQUENCE 9-like n=1 Tax=Humulus lupulus TaxID=3486 RepID=UPI002B40B19A|nr:protein FAR1-RELATED SEQUENCE 9-like [Humulus lupulus]